MKDYLNKFIQSRTAKLAELETRSNGSTNLDEVRAIGKDMDEVRSEIRAAEAQLNRIEQEEQRGKNPFPTNTENRDEAKTHLEYRKAFKDFVQKGTPIPDELREAGPTLQGEVSALIPTEIMDEVLRSESDGIYGKIYGRVRKMGVPFGVQFPISQLKATFSWITESATIVPEKAGDANTYVTFGANIGSVSFSQSLLVTIQALPAFEREMARLLKIAFLKAMDTAIINGTGSGQPKGILKEARVTNKVTFGDGKKDIDDWKKWNALLWSKIPEEKEDGVLIVGKTTWYTHLLNMADANNRPLAYESISQMAEKGVRRAFMGREVIVVSDTLLPAYDTAGTSGNDIFAIWGDLRDYGLNELEGFGLRKWEKHESHQIVTEGLVVADGHVLEAYGFFKVAKGA